MDRTRKQTELVTMHRQDSFGENHPMVQSCSTEVGSKQAVTPNDNARTEPDVQQRVLPLLTA
eukprot:2115116-Amphidinium_carterae.1